MAIRRYLPYAVHATGKVFPQLREIRGPRVSAGHADDCDVADFVRTATGALYGVRCFRCASMRLCRWQRLASSGGVSGQAAVLNGGLT